MKLPAQETAQWLKRRVNALKAERGLSWAEIAERLSARGASISPGSLMSKHSRGSFTALELIALLQALDVQSLELPDPNKANAPPRSAHQPHLRG